MALSAHTVGSGFLGEGQLRGALGRARPRTGSHKPLVSRQTLKESFCVPGPRAADLVPGPRRFRPFPSPKKCAPGLCVFAPKGERLCAARLSPGTGLAPIKPRQEAGGCWETGSYGQSQPTVCRSRRPGAGKTLIR